MKNKTTRVMMSTVIAITILSNTILISTHEGQFLVDKTVNTIQDIHKDENNRPDSKVRINLMNNRQFVYYDDKNKYEIKVSEENVDEDYILKLLNMSYDEYKNELKRGESLQSLLEKNNVTKIYNDRKYLEYANILENAVKNNAISQDEMYKLLNDYIKNIEAIIV